MAGMIFGTQGLPDAERPLFAWLINAMIMIAPFFLMFWLGYRRAAKRNFRVMPGIDASWYRLTVGESALTTEDDTVIQIQRYNRFQSYQTTATMLILYRANRNFIPIPYDRVPEDVRRKLLNRLMQAGVSESHRPSIFRRAAMFALPALIMFVFSGMGQGS